jgi:hypothetical protein
VIQAPVTLYSTCGEDLGPADERPNTSGCLPELGSGARGGSDPVVMDPEMQSFQFGAAQFVFDPVGNSGTLIKFSLPALQLMVVSRGQLPNEPVWRTPGIYFLFGAGDQVGTYRIYVGMAPAGVAKRVSEQERQKDWWDRALLVVADRSSGFTTSEVAWLEARFIAKLREELGDGVANKNQPSGDQLEPWKVRELEANIAPVEAVLRLLGMLSVSSEPQIANDDEAEESTEAAEAPPAREIGNPTWVEAALHVLPTDGSGVHAKELLRQIVEGGHRDVSGMRTPENTLRRDLRQEALREGGRVAQVGPSTFALNF